MANNGNYSKFAERIKKIAFRKRIRKDYNEEKNSKMVYYNVLKVLAAIPGMVYTNLQFSEEKSKEDELLLKKTENNSNKEESREKIKNIDIEVIKSKQEKFYDGNDIKVEKPVINDVNNVQIVTLVDRDSNANETNCSVNIVNDTEVIDDNILKEDISTVEIASEPENNISEVTSLSSLKSGDVPKSIQFESISHETESSLKSGDVPKSIQFENILHETESSLKSGDVPKSIQFENILHETESQIVNEQKEINEKIELLKDKEIEDISGVVNLGANFDNIELQNGNGSEFEDTDKIYLKNEEETNNSSFVVQEDVLNPLFGGVSADNVIKKETKVSKNDDKYVKNLEKDILNTIQKRLVLSVNNLEVIQSELYVLKEVNGDSKNVFECEEEIKKINILSDRINKLKEQYDFLKDNYDFEYLMAFNDNNLIDKIIELRDIFDKNQIRATVADYKLLNEYKYLYLEIDRLHDNVAKFEKNKSEELEEVKKRNINYEEIKNRFYNVDDLNNVYANFVKEQSEILKNISENVSKISSYEVVDYHIKGLNKLFLNSFKYFGLLMLHPLKVVIPSIAMETMITHNLISSAYRELKFEETKKKVYETVNYTNSLDEIINDMNRMSDNIDRGLVDLLNFKNEFCEKFSKYQYDFSDYNEVIKKINALENKMLNNKIKIEIMKNKSIEYKRVNNKKLVLVNNLNNNT